VLRGAIDGSDATAAFDGAHVWTHRRPLLLNAMYSAQADIICVQECLDSGESNSHELGAELGVSVYQDAESPGLAILSHLSLEQVNTLHHLQADWYGYAKPLHAVASIDSTDISIICVHLPLDRFGPRNHLTRELASWRSSAPIMVLAGDLNASPSDESIRTFLAAGYSDLSRSCGPTMPNPEPVCRLDYVLARTSGSGDLSVVSASVLGLEADASGFFPSDHAGVSVEFEGSV